MAEVNPITNLNQNNADVLLEKVKLMNAKREEQFKNGASVAFATGLGLLGTVVPGIGNAIGAAVGSFIGKYLGGFLGKVISENRGIFDKAYKDRDAYSDFSGDDKGAVVDGAIAEVIYKDGVTNLGSVESLVVNKLKDYKVLLNNDHQEFYKHNNWARNHVIEAVKEYNKNDAIVKRSTSLFTMIGSKYETSKIDKRFYEIAYKLSQKLNLKDDELMFFAETIENKKNEAKAAIIQQGLKGNKK